jgi:hypothetical protein
LINVAHHSSAKERAHAGRKDASMSHLRLAIIGAGNIAQQHLSVLINHPHGEVTALYDVNPEAGGPVLGGYGAPRWAAGASRHDHHGRA